MARKVIVIEECECCGVEHVHEKANIAAMREFRVAATPVQAGRSEAGVFCLPQVCQDCIERLRGAVSVCMQGEVDRIRAEKKAHA